MLQVLPGGPLCDCAAFILVLASRENHTSVNPGCWSGYNYELTGHGTVTMNMTLQWSADAQVFGSENSTYIQAQFTF